jgi:hypothetical protein
MQKLAAWLQYSSKHDEEHLTSFDSILSHVENTLEAFTNGAGDHECAPVVQRILLPRMDAAKTFAKTAQRGLKLVEHLAISGLCHYCFPEEEEASFRIGSQDGPAAEELSALGAQTQAAQRSILETDMELLQVDPDHRCVPEYLYVLISGSEVSDLIRAEVADRDGHMTSAIQATMMLSVQAVSRMRSWPSKRRDFSLEMKLGANSSFDEDIIEVAERLQSYFIGPAARLAHQVQMLALTLQPQYHWSSKHPLARLLWGPAMPSDETTTIPLVSTEPEPHAPDSSQEPGDVGAAFGLVVLISNRTALKTIKELVVRLEGDRTLFLEESCGDALETLGYGCHGGGEQQGKCLRPVHVNFIAEYTSNREEKQKPRVAWRRHSATQSIAHAAWDIGTSYWGADAQIWMADFRRSCACPGTPPLEYVLETAPDMLLHLVKEPEVLWSLDTSMLQCSDAEHTNAGISEWVTSIRNPVPHQPLSVRLSQYITFHRQGVAAIARGDRDVPVLVYSCQPFAQCGGHGDRLNGIVTAFFLAVLTQRVFLIDYESPLPLQMLLAPNLIDWRVRGGIMATAGLRHHSYHDKRRQFEADISRLAEYPDPMLIITKNYRMLRSLFEAPALRSRVLELGLPVHAPKFLIAEVFDVLFTPSLVLQSELSELRLSLGLHSRRFIAIHLRTGNIAWDPQRHGVEELFNFLACAGKAEKELGFSADTPWFLATDSAAVAEVAMSLPEASSGKLRVPGAQGRIHIDRSELSDVLSGTVANYAEYLLFGEAAAVILSRSYFGETAAEIGRVPSAYFAPGGGCVRTDLTSS